MWAERAAIGPICGGKTLGSYGSKLGSAWRGFQNKATKSVVITNNIKDPDFAVWRNWTSLGARKALNFDSELN
jgi:hypothetical protein